MDDFTNSFKSKEVVPQKKIEAVVTKKDIQKKTFLTKLRDTFISDDIKDIKSYILTDVLIPAIKKSLSDIGHGAVDMIFGKSSYSQRSGISNITYVKPYNNMYTGTTRIQDSRAVYDYSNVIIYDRKEAEAALDQLLDILATYKCVRVADFYDVVGITNFDTSANKYGWTTIRSDAIIRNGDGWVIRLPKAMPID